MLITARWKFVDELRIHAGERGVTIRVGHKWVRLTETASGRTTKVRREIYELTKKSRLVIGQPG
jgi:flavin-dependent dehydrogenase